MNFKLILALWLACPAVLAGSAAAQTGGKATSSYKVQNRFPIDGTEGWDYITVDSAARRLYVSHGVRVNVLDADTGSAVGTIEDTPGVHGIAIASSSNHGFTSNGKENKVSVFDANHTRSHQKGRGRQGAGRHLLRCRVQPRLHQQPWLPRHHRN
jgi:hypothetical protein